MPSDIKNPNLWVAEELLRVAHDKPYLASGSGITLELEGITELPDEQVVNSLKRLEYRKSVGFDDEEDKYDIGFRNYINLYFDKDKTNEFVETAKERFYGILPKYKKKKDLNYVFEALSLVLEPKYLNKEIEFSDIGHKYTEILEWIADYSGAIGIKYSDEPDVEWKDTKRPIMYGVSEVPKSLHIINRNDIEKLNKELHQFSLMPQQKRVNLFLDNHPQTDWKCAHCGHFLSEKLNNEKPINNYLNAFRINRFRVCYKCRKRNYFLINQKGEIKFFTTRKKMLGEKETREEKVKELNKGIKKLIKAGILPQKNLLGVDKKQK